MSSDYQQLQDEKATNINSISSSYDDENPSSLVKKRQPLDSSADKQDQPKGDPPKKLNSKKALKKLYSYTWKYKGLLIWGQIGLLLTSLTTIALPYLCGEMIDAMTVKKDHQRLQQIAFYFIIVSVGNGVFSALRGFCFNYLGERVVFDLQTELFNNFIRKDTEFYDANKSGELISRITSDTTLIQSAASDNISILLRNLIQVIGSLILLWIMSWQLTIALLLCVPPTVITVAIFINYYKKLTKLYQDQLAISNAIAVEVLGNIRIVKSFATEKKEGGNFSNSQLSARNLGMKRSVLYGAFLGIVSTISFGSILTVIWYGGSLVLDGELSSGQLTSFVLYTITLSVGLLGAGGIFNNILTALAVADKLFDMMAVQPQIISGNVRKQLQGNIRLENVKFNYPSKEDVIVLKNINIDIKPGEVVALVGSSGSGKSSIVALVQRFYDVNEGRILIDGENIKSLDSDFLHHNIGFVSQEPTLFSGTLYENITYGVQGQVSLENLNKAISMANASFIEDQLLFPLGLETVVGERGIQLSGGQKQRIAIARALIQDPRILIFDEATSALDAESEYQVQQAIDGLMKVGQKNHNYYCSQTLYHYQLRLNSFVAPWRNFRTRHTY